METGKHTVDVEKRFVTFGHKTKTADGFIELTTSFDFSKVDMKRLLKRAADAELISWRNKVGIKGLTTEEAKKTLTDTIVDCSAITERVKHVETEEEKKVKELLKKLNISSHDLEGLIAKAAELKAARAASDEAAAQADLEQGESQE